MDKVAIFKGQKVRRVIYQNEWWFSVVDVCGALTDSADSGAYWRKLKQRLKEEGSEVVTFCHELKLEAPDGKKYETDCANTEGIFRIIQWKSTAAKIQKGYQNLKVMPMPVEILLEGPEKNLRNDSTAQLSQKQTICSAGKNSLDFMYFHFLHLC